MTTIAYERPKLADYQVRAIFNDARYGIVEASTKSGKTHGCLAWLFERAALDGAPGRNFWWVAPVYQQAEIAYRRMARAIPIALRKLNDSKLCIVLANGAIIWFKSGEKPDNLYGEDVYAAVIDEASRLREESYHALRSTLTKTRGKVRIIGNLKGRKNWFYHIARRAQGGDQDMAYAKITAFDAVAAGIIDMAEVEDARRNLPEQVFRELFLAEPSDDGGNPFGLAHIAACVKPLSDKPVAAHGIDLAKSVDWTVNIGLDAQGVVAEFDRFQSPWKETIERLRAAVGAGRALVDSTGVGDPVVEALQRGDGYTRFEGFKFSSQSKQQVMEGLAVGIQQHRIGYPDGPIRAELEAFEYEYTSGGVRYSAPEGMHDDCVMALALAWHKLGGVVAPHAGQSAVSSLTATMNGGAGRPAWL